MYADKARIRKGRKIIYYKAALFTSRERLLSHFGVRPPVQGIAGLVYTLLTMLRMDGSNLTGSRRGCIRFQVLNDGLMQGFHLSRCVICIGCAEYRAFLALLYIFTNHHADAVIVSGDLKVMKTRILRLSGCLRQGGRL